jgi:hypothetical protein
MGLMTPETEKPAAPSAPAPVVPNFREDERLRARYQSMLERRIKTFAMEHESSIRRNASAKRDELREQLDAANEAYEKAHEAAEAARAAYGAVYPDHVKKLRLVEPSMVENMRSLGAAGKLYKAAQDAWLEAERATSDVRRIEHNEEQLEIELKKAIERSPQVAKDVTESEKWLAEIHAEEDLASARAKVDEIDAEREAFAKRLAAGSVPPEELRLRTFAEADVKRPALPLEAVMFYRLEQFGPSAYFILRDKRKQLFALPYDRRLESKLDAVYDVVQAGDKIDVRRSVRENTRLQLTVTDHFIACNEGQDTAAQLELRDHRKFVSEKRMLPPTAPVDEGEAKIVEALIAFGSERAT